MKTLLLTLIASISLTMTAAADYEHCVTQDYDQDGVVNDLDSDEYDSCLVDPEGLGLNDCSTGAGDGIPDVQACE